MLAHLQSWSNSETCETCETRLHERSSDAPCCRVAWRCRAVPCGSTMQCHAERRRVARCRAMLCRAAASLECHARRRCAAAARRQEPACSTTRRGIALCNMMSHGTTRQHITTSTAPWAHQAPATMQARRRPAAGAGGRQSLPIPAARHARAQHTRHTPHTPDTPHSTRPTCLANHHTRRPTLDTPTPDTRPTRA